MKELREYNVVPAMQDVFVTFQDIDKMEEKHKQFDAEADAIRLATIREWNKLFDALMKLQQTHQQSNCLWDSRMGDMFSAYKRFMTDKEDEPQPAMLAKDGKHE